MTFPHWHERSSWPNTSGVFFSYRKAPWQPKTNLEMHIVGTELVLSCSKDRHAYEQKNMASKSLQITEKNSGGVAGKKKVPLLDTLHTKDLFYVGTAEKIGKTQKIWEHSRTPRQRSLGRTRRVAHQNVSAVDAWVRFPLLMDTSEFKKAHTFFQFFEIKIPSKASKGLSCKFLAWAPDHNPDSAPVAVNESWLSFRSSRQQFSPWLMRVEWVWLPRKTQKSAFRSRMQMQIAVTWAVMDLLLV